jgi:LPXTG-motif cell wall-anchored protein
MPVLFLPETGERPISGLLWVFSVLGVGLGAWVIYLLRYRGNRGNRPD